MATTNLTFTKVANEKYTAAFQSNGDCQLQINRLQGGVILVEAGISQDNLTPVMPPLHDTDIIIPLNLPADTYIKITSNSQVSYAAIME